MGEGGRLRYNPALDGIRALAVLAVIASHELTSLPGGFYGVDTFFVLSGFLITTLLVTEWDASGAISLGRFWARRARRLLPALYVLVIVVGVVAAAWPASLDAPNLLANGVATLFYSANWYLIAGHASYFTAVAQPSPLQHTWSLAIEEQFYLVWPLVVLAVLRPWRHLRRGGRGGRADEGTAEDLRGELTWTAQLAARRLRQRRLVVLCVLASVGALASASWMAALSPWGGPASNRAYYGTDTRMQALMVGAALAAAFARWGPWSGAGARRLFSTLAVVGVASTAALWLLVPSTSALAFHGGFLLAALSTAAVVACVVQVPRGLVHRALALEPLRSLGRISYGVYLWYWPVLLVVNGARTHLEGFDLFVVRVAVTVAIATVSYHLVERPIRAGALPRRWALVAAPVAAIGGVVAVLVAGLVPLASAAPAASPTAMATVTAAATAPPLPMLALSPAVPAGKRPVRVLLVGDSVAGSLGVGLEAAASRYGIVLVNEGAPGCSLSMDQSIKVLWYVIAPGAPCQAGNPQALLDQWQQWVDAFNPDVVLYVARGELFDQEVDGQWSNVTVPSFDRYLSARFAAAIKVLGSRGAAVVLMTTPAYDSGEQDTGQPWPEDAPQRVAIDNALIRTAAASTQHAVPSGRTPAPAQVPVSVFDLESLFTPGGQYRAAVDGVTMRCSDGVHFTAAAGEWLAPRLFPEVVALGRAHQSTAPSTWPGPLPPAVPGWWSQLPCG